MVDPVSPHFTAIRLSSPIGLASGFGHDPNMGFNRRKMEDQRRTVAATRRRTNAKVLGYAEVAVIAKSV
jgi:hypothetical protein